VARKGYLVVFALALVMLVAGVMYWRHVKAEALRQSSAKSANCDTPAPPPKPVAPPPKLPGFEVQAACGPGEAPPKPADKKK
jgi:hypothetical protein